MSLPGGKSDQRSTGPKVWPDVNLTQSLILGVHLTKYWKVIWKFEHTTRFCSCFTEVFSYERPMNSVTYLSVIVATGFEILIIGINSEYRMFKYIFLASFNKHKHNLFEMGKTYPVLFGFILLTLSGESQGYHSLCTPYWMIKKDLLFF